MEKKVLFYLPFQFLLALIVGICLQYYKGIWKFQFLKLFFLYVLLLLLLALFHYLKKRVLFGFFTVCFFLLIGISSVYIKDSRNYKNYYTYFTTNNSSAVLKIYSVLKPSNNYTKYKVKVVQINNQKTRGNALLNILKDSVTKPLKVGNLIFLKPTFKTITPPLNPHQFDYQNYLAKQQIYQQVFTNNQQYQFLKNNSFSLVELAAKFRNKIQHTLKKYPFKKDEYAIINALLLGQRQDISKELITRYKNAGAIHILAVSGLHIGIILLVLNFLFKKLTKNKNGRFISSFLIILFLWMFAFIAGLSASVVRAVTMFSFVAIGQLFQYKKTITHSLIASLFLILLVNPLFLFDVGFQLSYLAVFGIVGLQPLFYKLWHPNYYLLRKVWQLITVSLAAQIAILPISLYYFHQFPSLFLLSNLVIIPFLSTILLGGIFISILALLKILPLFIATIYGTLISIMNSFINWVAYQEAFLFQNISMDFYTMLLGYIFLFLLFYFFVKKTPKMLYFVLIGIIPFQISTFINTYKKNKKEVFIVFHKNKKALFGERKRGVLTFFTDIDTISLKQESVLISYKIGENISLKKALKTPNVFSFKNNVILRIDSLGIYKLPELKKPIVLLQHTPKINLNRVLKMLKPTLIVADGTNYKSIITQWKTICKNQQIPFFYTGEKGAFMLTN